jgi:thioredoxin reductase (NADPH)
MSQYLVDQLNSTPNIEILTNVEVTAVHGKQKLEAIDIRDNTSGAVETVNTPAMFIFIGANAHTEFIQNVLKTNRAGFILTGPDLLQNGGKPKNWGLKRDPFLLETSVPGIFAAGDVRQGAIRRVASAVGEGAIAVSFIHQYLKTV